MSTEKTEKPTPKKIEDAREKGQVPLSRDVARLGMLSVVMELAFITERYWRESIHSLFDLGISRIGEPFMPTMLSMFSHAGVILLLVFGILFVVCSVVAVAGFWGQFGVLIAPKALTPNFDKINPANGFKELFSKKKLVELLTMVFKTVLIGVIVFVLARDELPDIVQLSGGGPKDVYFGFVTILRSTFHIVIAIFLLMAGVDFALQKHFHTKSLMMDMQEIRREYKETEGDPLIKGARRQLARELVESGPVARTEDANAVVVNPTHFAVAMLYEPGETPVPVVLAKGKDEVAQAMIRRARECGIPVIRHVWLARTLYASCRADTPVPISSYEAVAYVYAVVNELQAMGETQATVELESHGNPPHAS